jgi:hypothetical protein
MRTKTLILVAVLCALGFKMEVQATNPQTTFMYSLGTDIPVIYDRVELHGDLATSVGPNAIEAGASDDAVYIGFNLDFGNVSISIYNSMGNLVYRTVVNTAVQQVVIIPFTGFASGTYTIELNNANGYAEGDFEHDN